MAYHRIYKYTSIGRPLDPAYVSNKAVLILMPVGAALAVLGLLGAALRGGTKYSDFDDE